MRICILTFHRAQNYGAVLQAYALQKKIEELGYTCDILDYRCEKIENSYKLFGVKSPSPKNVVSMLLHLPFNIKKEKSFAKFRKQFLRISEEIYTRQNIANSNKEYDVFIVGSDQVWNGDLTGVDRTYFLDFVKERKTKIAYAASVGKEGFALEMKELIRDNLNSFSAVSVREEDTIELLHKITNTEIECVMDPVFLQSQDFWNNLVSPRKIKEKYIFLFELHEHDASKYAVELANKMHMKVVYVPNGLRSQLNAEKVESPLVNEFLSYIKYAEYVVTDSFHAAAFSIIFHKNLHVLLKTELKGLNSRLTSLLNKLGLIDRIVEPGKICIKEINYDFVEAKLEDERSKSLEFLKDGLKKRICR